MAKSVRNMSGKIHFDAKTGQIKIRDEQDAKFETKALAFVKSVLRNAHQHSGFRYPSLFSLFKACAESADPNGNLAKLKKKRRQQLKAQHRR